MLSAVLLLCFFRFLDLSGVPFQFSRISSFSLGDLKLIVELEHLQFATEIQFLFYPCMLPMHIVYTRAGFSIGGTWYECNIR